MVYSCTYNLHILYVLYPVNVLKEADPPPNPTTCSGSGEMMEVTVCICLAVMPIQWVWSKCVVVWHCDTKLLASPTQSCIYSFDCDCSLEGTNKCAPTTWPTTIMISSSKPVAENCTAISLNEASLPIDKAPHDLAPSPDHPPCQSVVRYPATRYLKIVKEIQASSPQSKSFLDSHH